MSQEGEKQDDRTKIERVKQHLQENKKVYLVGAGCLAVGSSVTATTILLRLNGLPLEIQQKAKNTALIIWKPKITQIALVKRACREPIPVLDKLTGEPYPSINRAAAVVGKNAREIAQDIHGLQERFAALPNSVFA